MNKLLKILTTITLASLLIMAPVSCSAPSLPSLKSIAVSRSDVHIYTNYGTQLIVTAIDTKGNERDVTATSIYRSSNEKIATVTAGGYIEGRDGGSAAITITYTEGEVTRTITVPVTIELLGGTETFSGVS